MILKILLSLNLPVVHFLFLLDLSILFGKFSSDLDNRDKNTAWGEIVLKAKSLGLATANRDIAHVRDKMWSVWKSRALVINLILNHSVFKCIIIVFQEKRDNRNKTGTGGGKAQVMTEVDKLIIDIIGSETVAVDGMEIGKSLAPQILCHQEILFHFLHLWEGGVSKFFLLKFRRNH